MRIALDQLRSTDDPGANLELVAAAIARAAATGARLLVLPEATMCRFGGPLAGIAEPVDGPWGRAVSDLADAAGIAVVVGMFTPGAGGRVRNTLLVTGAGVRAHYDKIHLYDAFGFAESDTVEAGGEPVVVTVDGVGIGLATCYDLRFPGLFQTLGTLGAAVVVVAASWGDGPGKLAQWELLAAARALDSTCWVVACGQAAPAADDPRPASVPAGIGHSRVVDPLGRVVAELGADPGQLVVDLDPGTVTTVRTGLPVLANRRF